MLAVDYDGTLAPIVPDPADAVAHPDIVPALVRLGPALRQITVVTGRPPATAVALGGLDAVPGLVVLGHYGRERWADGALEAPDAPPEIAEVRAALPALLGDADPGVRVEDKEIALAVHTRGAADPAGEFARWREPLTALAAEHGLTVEPGRFVLELRPAGMDKGVAVRALLDELSPACTIFIGDDLGDLAAFDALDAARADGRPALLVCSGSDEVTALAERADLVVDGPAGVAAFLTALAEALDAR